MKQKALRIAFMGPPGSGKGTQAKRAADAFGAHHLSSGDIIRENIRAGTELGKAFEGALAAGELGPTHLVTEMMEGKLRGLVDAGEGYVLDGFPRTTAQAEMLTGGGYIDRVLLLYVPGEEILRRITGRLSCECGRSYHRTDGPPRAEGVCDECGGALFIRPDDEPEKVSVRMDEYRTQTSPLIDYFETRGILERIDGVGSQEVIAGRIDAILAAG
jgi:adenylate kinase